MGRFRRRWGDKRISRKGGRGRGGVERSRGSGRNESDVVQISLGPQLAGTTPFLVPNTVKAEVYVAVVKNEVESSSTHE